MVLFNDDRVMWGRFNSPLINHTLINPRFDTGFLEGLNKTGIICYPDMVKP
jgi:hypothetical protein